jgi:hypothetical protein
MLDDLERQALEGRLQEAELTSQALIEAFGCGPLAAPDQIARLWLAEAVLLSARGEEAASDKALVSASRLSPATWQEVYGLALKERWEDAHLRPVGEAGLLRVEPLDPGYVGAIDGVVVSSFPTVLPPGLHLLQIGLDASSMKTAFRFVQPSGFDLVIDPKLPPLPVPPPVTQNRDTDRRQRRILHALAVGGAAGLVYGTTFATSAAYYDAPQQQRSNGLRALNDGLVLTSAGAGITSVVLLVRAATTPGQELSQSALPRQ